MLATNTSSLPVTALASAAARPEHVVGMHFFNPAAADGAARGGRRRPSPRQEAIETARAAGERMGKRVIVARDGPGFLANRCARPFGMEALKLLTERVADHATIDRIVRMGGGFRMGPFELTDLVGIDVGFEVSKSFWEQSFHEPRWRPSMIQARMVQAGRFGRKAGRGYYDYSRRRAHRTDDPEPPAAGGGGTRRDRGRRAARRRAARGWPRRPATTCGSLDEFEHGERRGPGRRRRRPLAARPVPELEDAERARAASSASTAASPSSTCAAPRSASTRCRRSRSRSSSS